MCYDLKMPSCSADTGFQTSFVACMTSYSWPSCSADIYVCQFLGMLFTHITSKLADLLQCRGI